MTVVLVVGAAIALAGIAMDAAPIQRFLTLHVTSRSLGSLAPGYAATPRGYRVYSGLVRAFGVAIFGLWAASLAPIWAVLFLLGVALFAFNTVRAVRGEIRTYRALKR